MRVPFYALLGIISAVIGPWLFQNRIVYGCGPVIVPVPSDFGLPPPVYNPVGSFLRNGTLVLFPRNNTNTTVYYFHANSIRRERAYDNIGAIYRTCNCSIYAVETLNCLEPSLFGNSWYAVMLDLKLLFWYTLEPNTTNVLVGDGMGAAYILNAYYYLHSHQYMIKKIVLRDPFTSTVDAAQSRFAWIKPWMIFNHWNNREAIKFISSDTEVVFIGDSNMTRELFEGCPSKNKTWNKSENF